jgi:quercetin dioxygenase-like cupin family protein
MSNQGAANPVAVNASEETIGLGAVAVRFLLTGSDTGGSMSIFEMTVPAGKKIPAPAHRNEAYEETLYGVEGVLTWTIDGIPFAVGPGQAVCVPRGAVHRFDNFGDVAAKQLVVIAPAIMGPQYFHDALELMRAAGGGPPDPVAMATIFRRHGMTIAAPAPVALP